MQKNLEKNLKERLTPSYNLLVKLAEFSSVCWLRVEGKASHAMQPTALSPLSPASKFTWYCLDWMDGLDLVAAKQMMGWWSSCYNVKCNVAVLVVWLVSLQFFQQGLWMGGKREECGRRGQIPQFVRPTAKAFESSLLRKQAVSVKRAQQLTTN